MVHKDQKNLILTQLIIGQLLTSEDHSNSRPALYLAESHQPQSTQVPGVRYWYLDKK